MKKIYTILILCVVGVLVYIFGGYTFTHYRVFKPYFDKDFQTDVLRSSYDYRNSIIDNEIKIYIDDDMYRIGCIDLTKTDITIYVDKKGPDSLIFSQYNFDTHVAIFDTKKKDETVILTKDEFLASFFNLELNMDNAKFSVKARTFSNTTKDNATEATFKLPSDYVTTLSLPTLNISLELSDIFILMHIDTNKSVDEIKKNSKDQPFSVNAMSNGKKVSIWY